MVHLTNISFELFNATVTQDALYFFYTLVQKSNFPLFGFSNSKFINKINFRRKVLNTRPRAELITKTQSSEKLLRLC